MSNMTAFEIRLELLKMARDMLSDEYFGKREQISNQWSTDCETAKINGQEPPRHPGTRHSQQNKKSLTRQKP